MLRIFSKILLLSLIVALISVPIYSKMNEDTIIYDTKDVKFVVEYVSCSNEICKTVRKEFEFYEEAGGFYETLYNTPEKHLYKEESFTTLKKINLKE